MGKKWKKAVLVYRRHYLIKTLVFWTLHSVDCWERQEGRTE